MSETTIHPFYAVYSEHGNISRVKHKTLASAVVESLRIAKKADKPCYIIEYADRPQVVGRCLSDGTMDVV